jgi:hypothetical protein
MSCCLHCRKACCGFGRGGFGAIEPVGMNCGSSGNLDQERDGRAGGAMILKAGVRRLDLRPAPAADGPFPNRIIPESRTRPREFNSPSAAAALVGKPWCRPMRLEDSANPQRLGFGERPNVREFPVFANEPLLRRSGGDDCRSGRSFVLTRLTNRRAVRMKMSGAAGTRR